MAVPTISTVTPSEGHTGGKTLVEIVGTNFREPTPPPPTGPTDPTWPPSVRVKFGGRVAANVMVWSPTQLYCQTPELDELVVESTWTALDVTTNTFTLTAHGLTNGTVVRLVETSGALPVPLVPETAYYVVGATANTFQLSATLAGPAIDITATGSGKALSVGAYDVVVENIDDDGLLIGAETVTATKAFTPRRPDLGVESDLARVVRAMIRMLKRQVLENVHFATHTDYDATTGDQLNFAFTQRLPAIILANLETPDDPQYRVEHDTDFETPGGRFIERRPPAVVMVKYDLIGVSDDPVEILNLVHVVRTFFRKNPYLYVDRDPNDPSKGQVRHDLEWAFSGPVAVAHAGDNSNVESFGGEVRVRGVLLEDMPGITTAKVPGIPADLPHEATTRYGHVSADDEAAVELGAQPDLDS